MFTFTRSRAGATPTCPRPSMGSPDGPCVWPDEPPHASWRVQVGRSDDLWLVARVHARVYLTLEPASPGAQWLTQLCAPGAALLLLSTPSGHEVGLACVRERQGRPSTADAWIAALTPLPADRFAPVAGHLLTFVNALQVTTGWAWLQLHYPSFFAAPEVTPSGGLWRLCDIQDIDPHAPHTLRPGRGGSGANGTQP